MKSLQTAALGAAACALALTAGQARAELLAVGSSQIDQKA
jgi:hypothetical protein